MPEVLEPPTSSTSSSPRAPRRWLARFALLAFGLYHVPLFLNAYPGLGGGGLGDGGLANSWGHVFGQVGLWVARHVLGLTGPMRDALTGDNGDTGSELGRLLLGVAIALVGAVIWTVVDRKRPGARWVEPALHVLLRYAIALGLASYAVAKILPVQFPPLDDASYEQRLGEMSPMSLMWSFMRYSRAYSTFAGLMEMLVVVLVAFRRTATIGALLCIVVMTNVALMDLCFDVPVKLFSLSMVVSAAAIVVFDVRRLVAVVLHRPVPPPVPPDPVFRSPALRALGWLMKIALIGGVIGSSFVTLVRTDLEITHRMPTPLLGTWGVTSFVRAGHELATSDAARWRRMANGGFYAVVRRGDDRAWYCGLSNVDAARLEIRCRERTTGSKAAPVGAFTWTRTGDQLQLAGSFDGAPVTIVMQAIDDGALPLRHHETRWVADD